MLQARWLQSPITLIFYWLFISWLFMLPGSALPTNNWFSKVYFDKWVHIGFFIALVFLLLSAIKRFVQIRWMPMGIAISYGFIIELIQHFFIPNRAFDLGDWIADTAGAFLGLGLWFWTYRKK
jgi:VanZ family protein